MWLQYILNLWFETRVKWIYKPITNFGVGPVKGSPTNYFRIDKEITHFLIYNLNYKLYELTNLCVDTF